MGAISFSLDEKLLAFLVSALPVKHFVETGAFRGDTLALARRFFPDCRSVEMSPELFDRVLARFKDDPAVQVKQGDSPGILQQWQTELSSLPVFFWLDAHWCAAGNTAGEKSQSPLLGELDSIGKLHPDSVLLIDDARLYLCPPPKPHHWTDWPDFHALTNALLHLSSSHRLLVFNDVIIFYPERIQARMLEFAHTHGVDWLTINNEVRSGRERRARRFPKAEFFRHQWRKLSR